MSISMNTVTCWSYAMQNSNAHLLEVVRDILFKLNTPYVQRICSWWMCGKMWGHNAPWLLVSVILRHQDYTQIQEQGSEFNTGVTAVYAEGKVGTLYRELKLEHQYRYFIHWEQLRVKHNLSDLDSVLKY